MSKTWDTKQRILELLKSHKMTLTEISKRLDLAPSTVNQHIRELLEMDAIRQVPNEFVTKWKYYQVNPQFNGVEETTVKTSSMPSPFFRVVSVLILLAVVGLILISSHGPSSVSASALSVNPGTTLFSISDSPTVSTIDSLNITVNSAMVQSTSGKWYTIIDTPKSYNLVALRNISQILAGANLSAGSYDQLVLSLANVSAVVNNQSVNVFLPNSDLKIIGTFNISPSSNSTSWVNLDVNLEKSLFITPNGGVVLLPVITLMSSDGANLSLANNGIITVESVGRTTANIQTAMNLNGSLMANSQPLPQNTQLNVTTKGKITLVSTPNAKRTIVIDTPYRVIVITNATNLTSVEQNLSSTITVRVPSLQAAKQFIETLRCKASDDSSYYCSAQGNLSAGDLVGLIQNRTYKIFRNWGQTADISISNNATYWNVSTTNSTSAPITTTVGANVTFNVTNPSNLPPIFNGSYAQCSASSDCILVHKTVCWNGLPDTNACINKSYIANYTSWYTSNVYINAKLFACPMIIIAEPLGCGCVSNTCTLISNGQTT